MKKIETLIKELTVICNKSDRQARNYLVRAREMKDRFGDGFAVIYCWFYSVPQKWTIIEPKIFELIEPTNSFDLETMIKIPAEQLALPLKAVIFSKVLSIQMKNFCKAIRVEYGSWDDFVHELRDQNLFKIFRRLRKYRNIRVTFKNLMAMKIFLGKEDDLMILDGHIADFLRIDEKLLAKCKSQEPYLRDLLETSQRITNQLRMQGLQYMTTAIWTLSVWFEKSKVMPNELLK